MMRADVIDLITENAAANVQEEAVQAVNVAADIETVTETAEKMIENAIFLKINDNYEHKYLIYFNIMTFFKD